MEQLENSLMSTGMEDRRGCSRAGTDRRGRPRLLSFLGGQITFNHGHSRVDCLVRNLAARGARLVIQRPEALPDQFDLSIAGRSRSFRAQVVWRRDREFGVRLYPLPMPLSPARLQKRIKELEAENALLRAALRQQP